MVNTNVRTLKIFEFDRALSYVSEIIEIERKKKQLIIQRNSLDSDFHDWNCEEFFATKEEKIVVNEIISEIKTKLQAIGKEISELEKYTEALKSLVTKIMEAVMEDNEGLLLKKDEIRQDMLEEYVYLLCEIGVEDEYIKITDLFDEVADFVVLLVQMYGEDVTNFVRDILNEDIGNFGYYFG